MGTVSDGPETRNTFLATLRAETSQLLSILHRQQPIKTEYPGKMLLKELGRTGIRIPEVGLGTWNYRIGPEPLRRGLEEGALFVDTAESYGTEEVVGKAMQGLRERVFVATKVSPENLRPDALRNSVDGSLRRLGIDAIDLLQLHHPNPSIPLQETMGAMADLVDAPRHLKDQHRLGWNVLYANYSVKFIRVEFVRGTNILNAEWEGVTEAGASPSSANLPYLMRTWEHFDRL